MHCGSYKRVYNIVFLKVKVHSSTKLQQQLLQNSNDKEKIANVMILR